MVARTGLPQSQVSTAIARLKDVGAVETGPDPQDRRRTRVRHAAAVSDRVAAVRTADIAPPSPPSSATTRKRSPKSPPRSTSWPATSHHGPSPTTSPAPGTARGAGSATSGPGTMSSVVTAHAQRRESLRPDAPSSRRRTAPRPGPAPALGASGRRNFSGRPGRSAPPRSRTYGPVDQPYAPCSPAPHPHCGRITPRPLTAPRRLRTVVDAGEPKRQTHQTHPRQPTTVVHVGGC
ncbi:hypothetical protein ACU686_11480 [Yinghuangia aomiensis]